MTVILSNLSSTTSEPYQDFTVDVDMGAIDGAITASMDGAAVEISESGGVLTITTPDPTAHGDRTTDFNTDVVITISDNSSSADITKQIQPETGFDYGTVVSIDPDGFYADDPGIMPGHKVYGEALTGDAIVDIATGIPTNTLESTYSYTVYDGVWSPSYAVETIEAPITDVEVTVSTPVNTTDGSIFYAYSGRDPVDGDIISHEGTTSPSNIAVTVLPSGIWQLASMPVVDQTFSAHIRHASGLESERATFTFNAPSANVTGILATTLDSSALSAVGKLTVNIASEDQSTLTDSNLSADGVLVQYIDGSGEYTLADSVLSANGKLVENINSTGESVLADSSLNAVGKFIQNVDSIGEATLTDSALNATGALIQDVESIGQSTLANATIASNGGMGLYGFASATLLDSTLSAGVEADTVPPVVTLIGKQTVFVAKNGTYTEYGAVAIDNQYGDVSDDIQVIGAVNEAEVGSYQIIYSVVDTDGNYAEAIRTVVVQEDQVAFSGKPFSPLKKYFKFVAGETAQDLGWSQQGLFDAANETAFGSADHNEPSIYGHKVVGIGIAKALRDGEDSYDGFILMDNISNDSVIRHVAMSQPYIERIELFDHDAIDSIESIENGSESPVVSMNFASAVDASADREDRAGTVAYISRNTSALPGGNLTSGQTYLAQISVNSQVLKSRPDSESELKPFYRRVSRNNIDSDNLLTTPKRATKFLGMDDKVNVFVRHNRRPLNLRQFDRFVLTVGSTVIDTNIHNDAIILDDDIGTLSLQIGDLLAQRGTFETTLVAYGRGFESGVVIWSPSLKYSSFTLNIPVI